MKPFVLCKKCGKSTKWYTADLCWDCFKLSRQSEGNPKWVGNNVEYTALHSWIRRHLGKVDECAYCGEDRKRIEWASISHHATRDLSDYFPLCVACHREYDKKARI